MKPHEISTPPSDLMDVSTTCAFLGKSKPWLYRAMRTEGLPARRMGKRWTFSKSELEAWFKALPGVNLPMAG
jgi:excisionase family DNA binding protein